MSKRSKALSFKEFGLQVQVESIRDVMQQYRLVKAMPDELLGAEKLSQLRVIQERLANLFESLDWSSLDTLLQKHCKHSNEWRKVS